MRLPRSASMGLRDWVSEKAVARTKQSPKLYASMGLRDWVSEKGRSRRGGYGAAASFNGAPRLGLGEGFRVESGMNGEPGLQWGSETGSRRRRWRSRRRPRRHRASMGLRDWVSEKEACRAMQKKHKSLGFNGAPRLGLGEGLDEDGFMANNARLQWGSETGSRRRSGDRADPGRQRQASMGLRDWVSEKAPRPIASSSPTGCFNGAPRLGLGEGSGKSPCVLSRAKLQWGSETGSRRRPGHDRVEVPKVPASMGLRDWVSEKVTGAAGTGKTTVLLQWGSETGSRRRRRGPRGLCDG